MLNFLGKRILQLIPTLFFVSILIFLLQHLLPGDPALVMAGEERDPEIIAQIREQYRLDQPMPVQYVYWVKGVLSGDFGESLRIKVPVRESDRAKTAGDDAARVDGNRDRVPDRHSRRHRLGGEEGHGVGLRRQSVRAVGHLDAEFLARHHADLPVLDRTWLAAGIGLRALAEDWRASLASTIMPAFVLGNAIAAILMRHTRSAMLQVLESDYVRTARAKGLSERSVILKHAMRNALTPVITLGALELGTLLSGAVLTEQIFSIPGFGKLIVDAVFNRDYAVVQGVVLVTATIYIMLNLIADIAYILVNPRLRA